MTAVESFVQALRRHGVDFMATLCGHGLDPLYQAARRAGLRLVDTRNEQTASYVADAAARLTGRLAVCAASSGLAHVNALTGIANAWFDGSPVLLISGSAAVATTGLGHFQDLDQVALARPLTKYARTIDVPERAVQILDEAVHAALAYPPGPVHLTFPMDIQRAEVAHMLPATPRATVLPQPEELDLTPYQRPLIVAGSGLFYAQQSLTDFCERYQVPVVVPIWDRGTIDRAIPSFMGVLGAATGGPELLADADCIVMAGARPDYRVNYLQTSAPVFYTWRLKASQPFTAWCQEARRRRDEFRRAVEETGTRQAGGGLHAIHIVAALREALAQDAVLLIDGGSIGQWAHQLLADRYPAHWLTCGPSAVVGWGLGGAMGARLVFPERPILLLSGDGAFTFTVAELEAAARQQLPFVAIVADDQGWGITRTGHLRQFGEAIASSLGPIAFDRLAQSLGAQGCTIAHPDELAPALRLALADRRVTVLHVPIAGGNP